MKKYYLPLPDREMETVILANGEFPSHSVPLAILNNSKYLVCCDGAIDNLIKTGRIPDAIAGDCDSLSKENAVRFKDIIHRNPDQETNDLTKSVQFCIEQGRKNICILGATGKREDHTIANVSLLWEYMKEVNVEMITDYGVFVAIDSDSVFESKEGQQVSLFSIDNKPITLKHVKFPVNDHVFTNWWQATLNEATGNEFLVETSGRTIVYRAF
ncbi:thiamine diphosphokinase [Prevotella sp. 10(H)]|uniref:thiamine diphosphokinase n=1 Tax=Prevotella sp. 10(H) TaxID=1158294 RepID=UPI0004A70937|nr:thiamine diphosphokinase [Prevotella sp. 10(H)]